MKMANLLSDDEIKKIVGDYMEAHGDEHVFTQEIVSAGEIPELKGLVVRPGKVSDCIYGGQDEFPLEESVWEEYKPHMPEGKYEVTGTFVKKIDGEDKTYVTVAFENPAHLAKNGRARRDMVRTPRISTHDKGRGEIPFKDQVLAINHQFMRTKLTHLLGNSQFETGLPPNAVAISAENLRGVDYEAVYRLFNAPTTTSTSLFVNWRNGATEFCGYEIPKDLYPAARLPRIWATPSTKSGTRDESVTPERLFELGVVTPDVFKTVTERDIAACQKVYDLAQPMGIIFVDTKLEHGYDADGVVQVQDEVFTLDSSRWWLQEDWETQTTMYENGDDEGLRHYLEDTQPGIKEEKYLFEINGVERVCPVPRSYSKEFARQFSSGSDKYGDDIRVAVACRYIEAIQMLTGERFEPDMRSRRDRIIDGLQAIVQNVAK